MRNIGIDLGRFSIKVACIQTHSKKFHIESFEEFEIKAKQEAWTLATLEVLRNLKIKSPGKIIVSMPESQLLHHQLQLPFKKKFNILKTLPFELEDELPMPISQCLLEANPLFENKEKQTEVFTTVASKKAMTELLNLCHEAGFEPDMVSAESFAMNPLYLSALSLQPQKEMTGFLHLGHKRSFISVYDGQHICEVRHIPWGGESILESLMKNYQVSYDKAVTAAKEKSFLLGDEKKLTESQKKHIQILRTEFEKLVHHMKFQILEIKNQKEKNFDAVFLSGGPSYTKGLPEYLSERLHVPCHYLKTHSAYGENPLKACVAIGLALQGMERNSQKINNLRKEEFSKKGVFWENLWLQSKSTAQKLGILLVLFLVFSIVRNELAYRASEQSYEALRQHAGKIAKLKGSQFSERKLSQYLKKKQKEKKVNILLEKVLQKPSALDVFEKLSESFKLSKESQFVIKELNISKNHIILKGKIDAKYLPTLEKKIKNMALNRKISKRPLKANEDFHYNFLIGI